MHEFQRWAVYAHKDDTGFGRQASNVRSVLGFGHHLVIPSERLVDHSVDGVCERWLPADLAIDNVRALLADLDGILFFERPNWHPDILRLTNEIGVASICVPNWEWFNGNASEWKYCDLFACPSRFTESVVRSYGFKNTCVLTWPLDLAQFPIRQVTGPARHFIHNAGLVDADDRKGTIDTIKAFCRLKRADVKLTVRMQKLVPLPRMDDRVEIHSGNCKSVADLYLTGDICVQPSKMEGIGFMVLEPVCSGLPVITTNYPPMNEYVHQADLRCRTKWLKRKAFATKWIPHSHLKLPRIRDLIRRMEWAANNDLTEISSYNRRWAEATFDPKVLRDQWAKALLAIGHGHD